jgi:hypothetical protein
MNALLELHIAPNRLYRINLVPHIFKSNVYLKFATLSAPNSFKSLARKSPKHLKTAFLWPNQPRPYENHGANGARR